MKPQIKTLLAAWVGWTFDAADGFLFTLVAIPFMTELMPHAGADAVKSRAALIQAVFLVGWALGGVVFGRIGDRLGRTKTLTLTILTYALCTGLATLSHSWWDLMIYRFLTGLGIGGEWAAGSALVSETFGKKYRTLASATLQAGYPVGIICAALLTHAMSGVTSVYGERWVFLAGILPALATFWIRRDVRESDEWAAARNKHETPKLGAIFGRELRKTTIVVMLLSAVCITAVWVLYFFDSQVIQTHPDLRGMSKMQVTELLSRVVIIYSFWNIAGYYASAYLAKWIGHRAFFLVFFLGGFATFAYGFGAPRSLSETMLWINLASFFGGGVFGAFPVYLPRLYPTLLRTTGAGFCYNFGRLFAAFGTLAGAAGAKVSPRQAIYGVAYLYLFGMVVALFAPEPVADEAET